jgi:hypothetical protein
MKKIFLNICMVCFFYLILISTASSGEMRVYDANDQFIGIYQNPIWQVYQISPLEVFIPSLNVSVRIYLYEEMDNEYYDFNLPLGTIRSENYFYQSFLGKLYIRNKINLLTHHIDCNSGQKRYFTIGSTPETPTIESRINNSRCEITPTDYPAGMSGFFEIKEIDVSEIPFTLPIQPPIRFEYEYFDKADTHKKKHRRHFKFKKRFKGWYSTL